MGWRSPASPELNVSYMPAQARMMATKVAEPVPAPNRELLARLTVRPVVIATSGAEPPAPKPAYMRGESGELITERLRIRALVPQDAPAFISLARAAREQVERFMPVYEPGETDEAMFARQLSSAIEGERHGHAWRRVIELAGERAMIGVINLNSIQRGMSFEADIATWISPAWQGKGLALEALRAVVGFATADLPEGLGLHRIHAGIAPANPRSASVALRAGFRRDGQKQSMLRVGDRWERHDFYVYDAPI